MKFKKAKTVFKRNGTIVQIGILHAVNQLRESKIDEMTELTRHVQILDSEGILEHATGHDHREIDQDHHDVIIEIGTYKYTLDPM